jgi:hypothetical protein
MKPVQKIFLDTVRRLQSEDAELARMDATASMAFARQLEFIESQTYDIEYPDNMARKFIPVDNSTPAGVNTITYRQWDKKTTAKVVANYSKDWPTVSMSGREFSHKAESFGNSYRYSVQDLRAAALLNIPLDSSLGQVARDGHENLLDDVALFGLPEVGFPGFCNHPNVPSVTLTTGTWASATTDQILEDLRMLAQAAVTRTYGIRKPNTILLDQTSYGRLQKPVGADYGDTIMSVFLRSNPYIKTIEQWVKLDTAASDGGPLIICYPKDPRVLKIKVLMEFTQYAPQLQNLEYVVNCESRAGGTIIYDPLAISYASNHA